MDGVKRGQKQHITPKVCRRVSARLAQGFSLTAALAAEGDPRIDQPAWSYAMRTYPELGSAYRAAAETRTRAALGRDIEEVEHLIRAGRLPDGAAFRKECTFERKLLAGELRRRKWSFTRISRAFNCDEKTVRRWTK